VLVFLIFGEFTPLLIPFLSPIVPGTCKIPHQIDKDRRKLEERRKQSFEALARARAAEDQQSGTGGSLYPHHPEALSPEQARHISRSLGLHASFLDGLGMPSTGSLQARIQTRLMYLAVDDSLVHKYGGVRELSMEELQLAALERGIAVRDKRESVLRKELEEWMHDSKHGEAALLRRLLGGSRRD
jgi:hypothetical protein